MEYLHTSEWIKEYLNEKIEEFELIKKIVCAIIDNRANMKKAIRIWDNVKKTSFLFYIYISTYSYLYIK